MKHRTILIAIVSAFALTVAYLLIVQPGQKAPLQPVVLPSPFAHGDGLSDSHDGYLIQAVSLPAKRGKGAPVAFKILGQDGKALTDYETVQTKQLHMYVIRDDISGYQHLHPTLSGDTWSTTMDVDDGGAYRIYAEFTPRGVSGHSTTLGLPFIITGDTKLRPLPGPAESTTIGGYAVKRLDGTANLNAGRSALLRFQVSDKDGRPVPHWRSISARWRTCPPSRCAPRRSAMCTPARPVRASRSASTSSSRSAASNACSSSSRWPERSSEPSSRCSSRRSTVSVKMAL